MINYEREAREFAVQAIIDARDGCVGIHDLAYDLLMNNDEQDHSEARKERVVVRLWRELDKIMDLIQDGQQLELWEDEGGALGE